MAKANAKLLMLVDEEPAQRRLVAAIAARAGWRTLCAADAGEALALLETDAGLLLDAVLIDHHGPGEETIAFVETLHAQRSSLPLLMITAHASVEVVVRAIRAGAADYLVKPIAPERLLAALDAAVSARDAVGELRPLSEKVDATLNIAEIVGASPQFRAAMAIAAKAARARVPVLIEGETGTGKELVAEAIHAASPRARKPWVTLNCAAVPPQHLAFELFGHERGAFAGAFDRKAGCLERADGGTLFIESVHELPLDLQAALLSALRLGTVQPLGARITRDIDVRLVVATDMSLLDAVANGSFREDLYFHLSGVRVGLPRLRDRREDIASLARHLLARLGQQPGMRPLGITDEALSLLRRFDWPGNVRQLQSALFRAALRCDGDALTSVDFPQIALASHDSVARLIGPTDGVGVTLFEPDGNIRTLEEIEADVIRLAIGHYRGRMTEVARRLGIGRSTLYRKLAELGIGDVAA